MTETTTAAKLNTMAEQPVLAGELSHAMRTTQRLIHNTNKLTHQQQITGLLRRMPIQGIETIDIIMRPKLQKKLTNDKLYDFTGTQLAEYLRKRFNAIATREAEHIYTFSLDSYQYNIIMVFESWEVPVAQLLHTGPPEFTMWLSTETERDKGAMPWGYYFKHYTLIDNTHKKIPNIKQEIDVFTAIGFNHISLANRFQGNKTYWDSFNIHGAVHNC